MEENDKIVVSYILKHQQDKNLDSISEILEGNKFWQIFPSPNVEVLSWNVLVGLGHLITLRFAPSQLREVNLTIEKGAWGAFNSEAYITYDYMEVWKQKRG
jgi:hypothetical protein